MQMLVMHSIACSRCIASLPAVISDLKVGHLSLVTFPDSSLARSTS